MVKFGKYISLPYKRVPHQFHIAWVSQNWGCTLYIHKIITHDELWLAEFLSNHKIEQRQKLVPKQVTITMCSKKKAGSRIMLKRHQKHRWDLAEHHESWSHHSLWLQALHSSWTISSAPWSPRLWPSTQTSFPTIASFRRNSGSILGLEHGKCDLHSVCNFTLGPSLLEQAPTAARDDEPWDWSGEVIEVGEGAAARPSCGCASSDCPALE